VGRPGRAACARGPADLGRCGSRRLRPGSAVVDDGGDRLRRRGGRSHRFDDQGAAGARRDAAARTVSARPALPARRGRNGLGPRHSVERQAACARKDGEATAGAAALHSFQGIAASRLGLHGVHRVEPDADGGVIRDRHLARTGPQHEPAHARGTCQELYRSEPSVCVPGRGTRRRGGRNAAARAVRTSYHVGDRRGCVPCESCVRQHRAHGLRVPSADGAAIDVPLCARLAVRGRGRRFARRLPRPVGGLAQSPAKDGADPGGTFAPSRPTPKWWATTGPRAPNASSSGGSR